LAWRVGRNPVAASAGQVGGTSRRGRCTERISVRCKNSKCSLAKPGATSCSFSRRQDDSRTRNFFVSLSWPRLAWPGLTLAFRNVKSAGLKPLLTSLGWLGIEITADVDARRQLEEGLTVRCLLCVIFFGVVFIFWIVRASVSPRASRDRLAREK